MSLHFKMFNAKKRIKLPKHISLLLNNPEIFDTLHFLLYISGRR